jgi:hypothetical protein
MLLCRIASGATGADCPAIKSEVEGTREEHRTQISRLRDMSAHEVTEINPGRSADKVVFRILVVTGNFHLLTRITYARILTLLFSYLMPH